MRRAQELQGHLGAVAGFAAGATNFSTGLAALGDGHGALSSVASAVGGAVGSIAGQSVGIAIGVQDEFSWSGVALGAIGAGVAECCDSNVSDRMQSNGGPSYSVQ